MKKILGAIFIIFILWLVFAQQSCNTSKQANKAMDKAFRKDSGVVAQRCSGAYPIDTISTKTDTIIKSGIEYIKADCPPERIVTINNGKSDTVYVKGKNVLVPCKKDTFYIHSEHTTVNTASEKVWQGKYNEIERKDRIKTNVIWGLSGMVAVFGVGFFIMFLNRRNKKAADQAAK